MNLDRAAAIIVILLFIFGLIWSLGERLLDRLG